MKAAARQTSMEHEGKGLRFSAAVLAGGRSTRMGTDKAFLRMGNDLLIERQLRCLRESGAAELLISGRAEVDYSRFAASVIHDEQPHAGPLAGVAAALKASSCPLVFVLAVDMPRMAPAMIRKIVSRCRTTVGCVPIDDLGFQPLAAAYPIGLLALAESQLRAGQHSMREFVELAMNEGFIQPLQLDPAEQMYFTNTNLPSQWAGLSG
jgi:molybdopterin-guanine dinucleotide biosynthesis protein A